MTTETNNQGADITLHWLDKSRAQRTLWLLEECKLQYNVKVYKRGSDMLAPEELKQIHPLGKSPTLAISAAESEKPIILAESGNIHEYVCEHFGRQLMPKQWKDGMEGKIGGETQEHLRYRYFMHYAEGSFMSLLMLVLFTTNIKEAPVPFFIKPITRGIASKIETQFLNKNVLNHLDFLESQMASSPDGGEYLCGKELTGADTLLIFPLQAARWKCGLTKDKYPHLHAYIARMEERDAYKRSVAKAEEITGEKFTLGFD